MINQQEIIQQGKDCIMNTYKQFPIVIEKGEGNYIFDIEGKKYLDFVAGIAVNSLGYGNKEFIQNIISQLGQITHCSNLYWNKSSIELAQNLIKNSCFNKAFFCNSGAEANEAAIKLARKYGKTVKGIDCTEIITMEKSFHGRTLGSLTATGQEKYQKDFTPLIPNFKYTPFNDCEALEKSITDKTCAIFIEPVQGEGGIKPAQKEFLIKARELCDKNNIVLVFDEVQCGIGRLGNLFAYQYYGVEPDIVTLAKGLGGGIPIGTMLAKDKIAKTFQPGDHASTFGGNPIATTAGKAVTDILLRDNFLEKVKANGAYLKANLEKLKDKYKIVKEVRGIGLMQGIELSIEAAPIVKECLNNGLLLVGAGSNIIRFVPPLTITKENIDSAIAILSAILENNKCV